MEADSKFLPIPALPSVKYAVLDEFVDDRGSLTELFRSDETDHRPVMGYISHTLPGVIRGPHEHRGQTDYFVFSDSVIALSLWQGGMDAVGKPAERVDIVIDCRASTVAVMIPPGVVHAYTVLDPFGGVILNFPDKLYAGHNKEEPVDEIRWENMPDSPYVVNPEVLYNDIMVLDPNGNITVCTDLQSALDINEELQQYVN